MTLFRSLLAALSKAAAYRLPLLGLGALFSGILQPVREWVAERMGVVIEAIMGVVDPVLEWVDGLLRPIREFLDSLTDRKSTRLNSSHVAISYAVFCLKKKNNTGTNTQSEHVC